MKESKINVVAIVILFLSLIFVFAGISVAVFTYFGEGMTNNVIQTGRIVFSYSDANGGTNGISIENAIPISDEMGKVLAGDGEYFDFTVSASTTTANLAYEIAVKKDDNSTLPDEWVKMYLTTFEGNQEVSTDITSPESGIITYSELENTTNDLLVGKTIYYGDVQAGEVSYGKKFRLRMWVKDPNVSNFDYSILNDKYFSIKVNVAATSAH